jgi:hypothetical protein
LLRRITASILAGSLILAPAFGLSAFAQTAAPAPAGTEAQPAEPATPAPKMMKKKPGKLKTAQKAPKRKLAPKPKAPAAGDPGQQPAADPQ